MSPLAPIFKALPPGRGRQPLNPRSLGTGNGGQDGNPMVPVLPDWWSLNLGTMPRARPVVQTVTT